MPLASERWHTGLQVPTHEHQVRPEAPDVKVRRSPAARSNAPSVAPLLHLQRTAGNAAVTAMLAQRRFDKTDGTDTTQGPINDIEDSALSGDQEKAAAQALGYVDAGTALLSQPWAAARVTANNNKVPNSLKKFKWGDSHGNRNGDLPGTKGAGGYKEYYLRTGDTDDDTLSSTDRLVISDSTGDVFHTDTHYGRDGSPAFTHYR